MARNVTREDVRAAGHKTMNIARANKAERDRDVAERAAMSEAADRDRRTVDQLAGKRR